MIIGNNNYNPNANNFKNKMNAIKDNASNISHNNNYTNTNANKYTDVNNRGEMLDKSFEMLQERLRNGLITLDEFNKQCNKLSKLRK